MNDPARKFTSGFTLIELMITVVLMALLSGAAAMSFVRPLRAARALQTLDIIRRADAMARQHAQRFGQPVFLDFDLNHQSVSRGSVVWPLPAGYAIRELRTGERSNFDGRYSLRISPLGLSTSYALHLVGPNSDRWILVAGLSGEMINADATQVAQFLREASRHDAH